MSRLAIVGIALASPSIVAAKLGQAHACAAIDPRALPESAQCEQRFPARTPAALFETADAQMKIGDLPQAERALQCAARSIAGRRDDQAQYEWVRRRGVLAYREERIGDALGHFECALGLAERRGDRKEIARQLKNVGSASRRIGDYRGALNALERSLKIMREEGDPSIGGVLSNIADVYRELGEMQQAERRYREAEAAFRRQGNRVEAAHILNSLGLIALDRRDHATAREMLETALSQVREENDLRYQLSFYAVLAKIEIADGNVPRAAVIASNGLAVAAEYDLPIPPVLYLQAARADRMLGRTDSAEARLRAALKRHLDSDADRAELMLELANTLEQDGRDAEAIVMLRAAMTAQSEDMKAQNDRQLGWLRTRFESAEDERTIAILRQRALLLWLTVASTLAILFALSLVFIRYRQKTRIADAVRQARYEEMLARYRYEANALSADRDRLQTLFDSRDDALCLLDAEGVFVAVNRASCARLGGERGRLLGTAFSALLNAADADAIRAALERMEDAATHELSLVVPSASDTLRVELTPWAPGDGLIVMRILGGEDPHREAGTTALPVVAEAMGGDGAAAVAITDAPDTRAGFRHALVELMLATIEAWERSSGENRIELAERSRIWCVNVDDGRLRTRAMDRYMSLAKLPRNPRWRDVLRTAYFVLGQSRLDPTVRDELQRRVDAVLGYARQSALV